jgi:predicted transposase YbfD/YdcC
MLVKGNQPQLQHDIRLVFQEPTVLAETMTASDTLDHGHGRLEERRLTASTALVEYSDWPGLAQVFQVERRVTVKKSGVQRVEVVYGVTSLSPERVRPEGLLRLVRQHWQIENQVHWVRDVTFDEDRSQVRCGSIPQVMAAFRNTAIGLLHGAGETNIAAACRRFAAQPWLALALIGITPEN